MQCVHFTFQTVTTDIIVNQQLQKKGHISLYGKDLFLMLNSESSDFFVLFFMLRGVFDFFLVWVDLLCVFWLAAFFVVLKKKNNPKFSKIFLR